MDQLKTFILTWYHIFIWANWCVWERISGQEVSCPSCWKCTTARWITFTVAVAFFLWITGLLSYIAYAALFVVYVIYSMTPR